MGVLPLGSLRLEKVPKRRAILRRRFPPIPLNGIPTLAEALLIGVAVLGNNRGDSLRTREGQAKSHRRAIIKHIERVAPQADFLGKCLHHSGEKIGLRRYAL